MFDQMKKLMEMKRQAETLKKELDALSVTVTDVPGITIVISGSQKFQSIELDFSVLNPQDKEQMERTILKSVNKAIDRSQAVGAEKMKKMSGLNIPGF